MKWVTRQPKPQPTLGDTKTVLVIAWRPEACTDGYTHWLRPRDTGTQIHAFRKALIDDPTTPYRHIAMMIGIGGRGAMSKVIEIERQDGRSYREGRLSMKEWKG